MVQIKDLPENFFHTMIHIFRNTTFRRGAVAAFFLLTLTVIISFNFASAQVTLKEGQVAPKDILAPRGIEFEDKAKTAEAKNKALESVKPAYDLDVRINAEVQREAKQIINKVRLIQKDPTINEPAKIKALKVYLTFPVDEAVLNNLIKADSETLNIIEDKIIAILGQAMEGNVSDTNFDDVKENMAGEVEQLDLSKESKAIINSVVQNLLRPNLVFNKAKTDERIRLAEANVTPYIVDIKQGQKIVGQGEIVTQDQIVKLQALGLLKPHSPLYPFLGTALLVLAGIILIMVYLYQYKREFYYNDKYLLLLGIISLSILLIAKITIAIQIPNLSPLWGYLVPVAAASMLIAILLDTRLALLITAILSIMLGILTGDQLRFTIVSMVAGFTAVYSVSKLSQSTDLAKAGLYISSANVFTVISLGLITDTPFGDVVMGIGLGIANGIFSAILTNGTLPYMETAFGITSSVKLLELSNPNHPLLRRLLVEAPGTYHHSIIVGNLAEAAAEAVGGDALLVRVGSYYHDIGKLKRPYFFIENQLTEENPHDKLAPTLSTLIITSHIKDGVELAKEHRLPQMLIDIIEQHHGTSLVSFFYHRATESDKNETFNEMDFRYEAPKPKSKEAALVMLADSVEAAVRSLNKPNPGRIEGLVRKIIKEKLNDGQLEESDLTFRDLDFIATAFQRIFCGIFHSRVEYPETLVKEMERRRSGASNRK